MWLPLLLACAEPSPPGAWTLLVYLNGDNDLEAAALADLNELERIGSTADVTVLAQLDRSAGYTDLDGDWAGARRYRVTRDDDTATLGSPVLADLGEVDSGSAETLVDFARWGMRTAPSERVALILWDHGSGWSVATGGKGLSGDEGSGTALRVAEGDLGQVLAGAADAYGGPLDLVGLDACWMMGWEVATEVAPHAAVLVASQTEEPRTGWSYDHLLGALAVDPDLDGAGLGEVIVETYAATDGPTLSALDLGALPALTGALDDLAGAATADAPLTWRPWASAALATSGDADRDLGALVDATKGQDLSDAVLDAADALDLALDALVLASTTQDAWSAASGLSIYAPVDGVDPAWLDAPWADQTRWGELLLAGTDP